MQTIESKRFTWETDDEPPDNCVFVGEGSVWENKYEPIQETSLILYEKWLMRRIENDHQFLKPLENKHLLCKCLIGQPCHIDVLLKYINKKVFTKHKHML